MSQVANYSHFSEGRTPSRAGAMTSQSSRMERYVGIYLITSFLAFCIRDGLGSFARFYLQKVGLSILWFIPDFFAFGAVLLFMYFQFFKEKNIIGIFFIISFFFSVFVSIFFMNDTAFTLISSVKMVIPMFVGFCFYNRTLTDSRGMQRFLLVVFLASAVSVAINPYVQYPWYGETLTNFGIEREVTRVWWSGGTQRYGGLAGDSTMAGFMTIFTFVLISPYRSVLFNVLCWPLIYFALKAADTKTGMGVFGIYMLYYGYIHLIPKARRLKHLRIWVMGSFGCLVVPPLMMIFLGGVDLVAIDPILFSLWDRINNTWNGPFLALADLFPIGYLTGCGIGCYGYPMKYTSLANLAIPLDNFYLVTFIMMGYPFLLFVALLFRQVGRMVDPNKLVLLMLWNVYTMTVQAYGPSYACVLYGYAISGLFSREAVRSSIHGISSRFRRRPLGPNAVAAE